PGHRCDSSLLLFVPVVFQVFPYLQNSSILLSPVLPYSFLDGIVSSAGTRKGNIEVQRIESISRAPPISYSNHSYPLFLTCMCTIPIYYLPNSPIPSHLTATLDGIESIRAYNATERFIQE